MNGFLELIFNLVRMLGSHLFFEYCMKGENRCYPLFFLHNNSGNVIGTDARAQRLSAPEEERPRGCRRMEERAVTRAGAFKNAA